MKTKFIYLLLAMIVMVGTAFISYEKETVNKNSIEFSVLKEKLSAAELQGIRNEEAHGVVLDFNLAEKTKTGYLMPVSGTNGPCGSNPQVSRYYYETSSSKYYCCDAFGCDSAPCPYCPGGGV